MKDDQTLHHQQLSIAGITTFFNIATAWGLDDSQKLTLLGASGLPVLYEWQHNPSSANLSKDTLERISYLMGIWKSLQILFMEPSAADAWIKKPNAAFSDKSALDIMLTGNLTDLAYVRSYLDAACDG